MKMKLLVFGATGGVGIEVVKQAIEAGHAVTAFVRDPARLTMQDERLTAHIGDVFTLADINAIMPDHDAVICALGSGRNLKKTGVRDIGTQNIIQSMQTHNVRRLSVVSAMGTGESWQDLSLFNKFLYAVLMKNVREEHEAQESAVKASALDWTIVRPAGLTDTPLSGSYKVGEKVDQGGSQISRADVAHLLLSDIQKNRFIGKAVTIRS